MTRVLGFGLMITFAMYGAAFLGLFSLPYPGTVLSQVKAPVEKALTPAAAGSFTDRISSQQKNHETVPAAKTTPASFTNRISNKRLSSGEAVLRQNMLANGEPKLFFES